MRRNLALSAAVLVSILPRAAATETPTREVAVYGGLATLAVPSSWNEVPPDVLEYFSLLTAEASGGQVAEVYQHGFRPGDPEAGFEPLQVLIQVRESGRVNYRQFLHLPDLKALRRQTDERLQDRAGPSLEEARLNEVAFDRDRYALRVANTLELAQYGTVLVKSASYLTERGTFTVHCYTPISENIAMRPIFEMIFDSVQFDPDLRYRPRLGDRLPPRPALVAYAIAAGLAVVTLILYLVQRRREAS